MMAVKSIVYVVLAIALAIVLLLMVWELKNVIQ